MEVNLCPSANFGQTSCSIQGGVDESFFVKEESLAVVNLGLDQCVTVVCSEDGATQYRPTATENKEEDLPKSDVTCSKTPPSPQRNETADRNPNKKKLKQWTEETMKMAIEHVQNGMKIRNAAEKFNVPRSTLGDRLLMTRRGRRIVPDKNKRASYHIFTGLDTDKMKENSAFSLYREIQKTDQINTESPPLKELEDLVSKTEPIYLNISTTRDHNESLNKIRRSPRIFSSTSSSTDQTGEPCCLVSRKRKSSEELNSAADNMKSKKVRRWTEECMNKAIEAVKNGMPMRTAAKEFDVPRTTLKYRIDGGETVAGSRKWSEEIMEQALDAIKSDVAVRIAARQFSIPRTTLQGRVKANIIKQEIKSLHHRTNNKSTFHRANNNSTSSEVKSGNDVHEHKLNPKTSDNYMKRDIPFQQSRRKSSIPSSTSSSNKTTTFLKSENKLQDRVLNLKIQEAKSNVKSSFERLSRRNRVVHACAGNKISDDTMHFHVSESISTSCKTGKAKGKTTVVCTTVKEKSLFTKTAKKESLSKNKAESYAKQDEKRKKWSEEAMINAVLDVRLGSCIRAAAAKYEVPRSTLGDRLCAYRRERNCPTWIRHVADSVESSKVELQEDEPQPRQSTGSGATCRDESPTLHVELSSSEAPVTLDEKNEHVRKEEPLQAMSTKSISSTRGLQQHSDGQPLRQSSRRGTCNTTCGSPSPLDKNPRHDHNYSNYLTTTQFQDSMNKRKLQEGQNSNDKNNVMGKNKKQNWSEEAITRALEAVDNELHVRHAARFSVPPATLTYRRIRRDHRNIIFGPSPQLSSEDEDRLVSYVNHSASFGFLNVKRVALMLAGEAASKYGSWNLVLNGLPSEEWWKSFCDRNEHHLAKAGILSRTEAPPKDMAKETLDTFYDKLLSVLMSSEFHTTPFINSESQIFTVDETKYDMNMVSLWVVGGGSFDFPLPNQNDRYVSTICCASASGSSIPPMFVYHSVEGGHALSAGTNGPVGSIHCDRKVYDFSRQTDFYFTWFKEIFLKNAPDHRPLLLLLDPHNSFITPEMIKLAHKNEVILLCLPCHCTHLTQALSLTVFPSLKTGFFYSSLILKKSFPKRVTFVNFAHCFRTAWDAAVDSSTIKSGFQLAGICPFDREAIYKRMSKAGS